MSFLLVLLTGAAVLYVWRKAGAFKPGQPLLVIWLSGASLPMLAGLAWSPFDLLLVVGPFMGLTHPEVFGAMIGEALWSGVWGLELAVVLSLIFYTRQVFARRRAVTRPRANRVSALS